MKKLTKITAIICIFLCVSSPILAHEMDVDAMRKIIFSNCVSEEQFNKVWLLDPGKQVIVSNTCTDKKVAIVLKEYLEVSSELALFYEQRNIITDRIIDQYAEVDTILNQTTNDIRQISENIQTINLDTSLSHLENSNQRLQLANTKLDSAMVRLDEMKEDINKIQMKNALLYVGFFIGGFLVGGLVGVIGE